MFNVFIGLTLLGLGWLTTMAHPYAVGMVMASVPLYLIRFSILDIPTNFFEAMVLVVSAVTLLSPSRRRTLGHALRSVPQVVRWCVGGWLIACLLATVISTEPRVSLGILKGWVVFPMLLAWLVLIGGPSLRSLTIRVLVAAGVITALVGLWQGLYALLVTGYSLRVTSIYDVPNSLALWLVPLIVLASWQSSRLARLAALIMGVALLLTQSVAGLVALGVTLGGGTFLFRRYHATRFWATLLLGTLIVAGFLVGTGRLSYLLSPWTTGQPNSISVRWQLWQVSLELVREHPLAGVGLGQFEPAYQRKLHERFLQPTTYSPQPIPEFVFRDPHNWVLSMWLNTGLLGLVAFMGLHGYLFWNFYQLPSANWRTSYQLQSLLLSLLSLLLFGLVDTIYWKNDLAALHWVLLALLATAGKQDD